MRKILFFYVLALLPLLANSQNIRVGFSVGTGANNMNSLKEYQDFYTRNYRGLDLKKTSSFPGYFNYSGNIESDFRKSIIGLNIGYQSTGGRVIYSDYSGLLRSDQTLAAFNFGAYYFLKSKRAQSPFLHLELGFINTVMEFSEEIRVNNFADSYSFDLNSFGSYFQLKTGYLFKISNIEFRPEAGYMLNFFSEQFRFSENEDALLQLPNDDKPKPNWSGFKVGLRVVFDLK